MSGRFAQYFLQSSAGQKQIFASLNQGAQANLFQNHIQAIRIPFPPTKREQEAIAEALSDADALIESLEQLIAKKRQIKQGAMQALLTGKKRLQGFKQGWTNTRLAAVCDMKSGEAITSELIGDGSPYPCFGGNGLRGYVTRYTHDGAFALIGRQGALCGNVVLATGRFFASEHAIVVSPHVHTDVRWLTFVLERMGLNQYSESSAQPGLSVAKLLVLECMVPPFEEQTAIASILTDMDTELAELETRLAKTRQLKQGMMQELLTGRIRLVRPVSTVVPLPKKRKEPQAATSKPHNQQINEAVVIAALTKNFGSEDWPLARVRRTKLAYLLHRHAEGRADGFLKKAAGPYDPRVRYKGPEGIALKKGYVRACNNGKYEGFVASENIAEAEAYFEKWYGADVVAWLEQFRLRKTDELELLTTVDMAVEDLRREGKSISVDSVKQLIQDNPEWKPKLDRPAFSDAAIAGALAECQTLFAS